MVILPLLIFSLSGVTLVSKVPHILIHEPYLRQLEKMDLKNEYIHIPASKDLSKLLKMEYFEKL